MHTQIDPATGVITTLLGLDASLLVSLAFTVSATNQDSLAAYAPVTVFIQSLYLKVPVFAFSSYSATIAETLTTNSLVVQVGLVSLYRDAIE